MKVIKIFALLGLVRILKHFLVRRKERERSKTGSKPAKSDTLSAPKEIQTAKKSKRSKVARSSAKAAASKKLDCRVYSVIARDQSKWLILSGRTADENDRLSLQIGRPHEVWMHVADVPGSHVVVRHDAGMEEMHDHSVAEPPEEVIKTAAGITAWNSKARDWSTAPVHITKCGCVSKEAGAPAGRVALQGNVNVMTVKPLNPAGIRKNEPLDMFAQTLYERLSPSYCGTLLLSFLLGSAVTATAIRNSQKHCRVNDGTESSKDISPQFESLLFGRDHSG
eukprot:gnl/MRDRNA2_/MRDRNA2_197294_c0_seq1.p1 gnl/MRDRNA2_/MRDRNA2_197294_c0~~gnl/MRDRNA2_/MRDRNA2_197294_c0_seq1.p1  ORF type:complete len:280 (-),score=48.24 gnl/MRDRNA2_/MRDRNA2_197294_c0_seq1:90-929(-)